MFIEWIGYGLVGLLLLAAIALPMLRTSIDEAWREIADSLGLEYVERHDRPELQGTHRGRDVHLRTRETDESRPNETLVSPPNLHVVYETPIDLELESSLVLQNHVSEKLGGIGGAIVDSSMVDVDGPGPKTGHPDFDEALTVSGEASLETLRDRKPGQLPSDPIELPDSMLAWLEEGRVRGAFVRLRDETTEQVSIYLLDADRGTLEVVQTVQRNKEAVTRQNLDALVDCAETLEERGGPAEAPTG
jgi:hypothetical protein